MYTKGKIIVASLNWGWGHATRCIPIITMLQNLGYEPVIASDGGALQLLQKEFPNVTCIQLPSYRIKYYQWFLLGMILRLPLMVYAVIQENRVLRHYLKNHDSVVGVISDNRLGLYTKKVPTVYITHQLHIFMGVFTPLVNCIHHFFIRKFNVCWVPDDKDQSLTGQLSKVKNLPKKCIGTISRLTKMELPIQYDVLILLSGIEGQRKKLEKKMLNTFENYQGRVVMVRGTFEKCAFSIPSHIKIIDYATQDQLQFLMNSAEVVISRSGYTTVMDLASLEKKAILIPTPGQTEQEYLARYLSNNQLITTCLESEFTTEMLSQTKHVLKTTDVSCLEKEIKAVF